MYSKESADRELEELWKDDQEGTDKLCGEVEGNIIDMELYTVSQMSKQKEMDEIIEKCFLTSTKKKPDQSLEDSFSMDHVDEFDEDSWDIVVESKKMIGTLFAPSNKENSPLFGSFTFDEPNPPIALSRLSSSATQSHEKINIESFGEMVGEGAFCQVFRAKWKGSTVAVKRFMKRTKHGEEGMVLARELKVLLRLRKHPNIVSLIGISNKDGLPHLVTEFCAGGSLYELLHEKKETPISWNTRIQFAVDVAQGMSYLHSLNPPVLHRDLKSPNVLIEQVYDSESRPRLKISDFGLSCLLSPTNSKTLLEGVGTCHWMAPELLSNLPFSKKADVYSFGILLYELIYRELPYQDLKGKYAIMQYVLQGGMPDFTYLPKNCPPELIVLAKECLQRNAVERPSFDVIISRLQAISCIV